MKAALLIARTEVLEHRRQPWMVFILALNFLLWLAVFGALFGFLEAQTNQPQSMERLLGLMDDAGMELASVIHLGVTSFIAFMFTNLPLYVALMAGYSVLHDRECGAMPFLMLSPLSRWQLLAGKLLGAMAIPLLLHLLFVGPGCLVLGQLEILDAHAERLGRSAAWWAAYLLGAPAAALLVGALGTVISALSRDVRTSMQYTSFFIGLLSLGFGAVLADGISEGLVVQLPFAGGCLLVGVLILLFGARLISRDVRPS